MTTLVESSPATLSESYLIGALMTDHDKVYPILKSAGISETSFSIERCARAWTTMERMRVAGSPVTLLSVAQAYGDDPGDSMTELEPMLEDCLTITHAKYHAGLVREAELGRAFDVALKTAQERRTRGDAPEDVGRDLGAVLEAVEGQSIGGPLVAKFPPIRFNDLLRLEMKPEENHILGKGWLRRGAWTLFTGGTGIGKSVAVQQVAACLACGKSIFGLSVARPFKVLLLTAEQDEETLQRDFVAIAEHEGLDPETLDANLQIHHAYALDGPELVDALQSEMERGGFDLVILDNYQAFSGDDINGSKEWKIFITPLSKMLKELRAAMLLVDHTGKPREHKGWGQNDSVYVGAGTSRKANGARSSAELYSPAEGDERYRLHFGKNWERTGRTARDLYLDRSPDATRPSWTPSADQTDHKPMVEGEQEIVDHATAHPFDSLRKIEAATGHSKSKVQRILKKHPLLSQGREEKP